MNRTKALVRAAGGATFQAALLVWWRYLAALQTTSRILQPPPIVALNETAVTSSGRIRSEGPGIQGDDARYHLRAHPLRTDK